MAVAALALNHAQPRHNGPVARFPVRKVDKVVPAEPILQGIRWPSVAEKQAAAKYAADVLPGLLKDLEAPSINDAARDKLERLIVWRGRAAVTLLIRTIIESEGNENALIEPAIDAVAAVMAQRPDWPERGLAWIEAFDRVSLLGTLDTMRSLKCFTVSEAPGFYRRSIQNQLRDIFAPAPPPEPPKRVRKRNRTKSLPGASS